MKRHIHQEMTETVLEHGAPDHHVSLQSLERFLENDRAWPAELWMKVRKPGGEKRVVLLRFQPDPCDPNSGSSPLERQWIQRSTEPSGEYIETISECPERIIAGCRLSNDLERFHAWCWERDNGRPAGYLKAQAEQTAAARPTGRRESRK